MVLYSVMKILIFAVNFVIFTGGSALFGMGVWIIVDAKSLFAILGKVSAPLKMLPNVSYLSIALGASLMLIGFLACCGAKKENKHMLLVFFLIILVIFLAQLVAGVIFLSFSSVNDIIMSYIKNWLLKFIKNDYGRIQDITEIFDAVMTEFGCCGINGYTDFLNSYSANTTNIYPRSCCLYEDPCRMPINVRNCYKILLNYLKNNITLLATFALATAIFEIGTMAISMIIFCQIKNKSIKA